MTTIARLANGTLFKLGDAASPEVFTTIPEVMKLSGPSTETDLLDVSSHDSPSLFREFITGWSDGGMVTAEFNWRASNATHIALRTAADAGTKKNFKIVFADTATNTAAFSGYIKMIEPNADAGKQMTARLQVKITGTITWS